MPFLSIPPAFPLLLALFLPFSEGVFPHGFEADENVKWSRFLNQPITGTDTSGLVETQLPDRTPNPAVFSPLASGTGRSGSPLPPARSQSTTCKVCGRSFKNSMGLAIHIGRSHKQAAHRDDDDDDDGSNSNPLQNNILSTHTHHQQVAGRQVETSTTPSPTHQQQVAGGQQIETTTKISSPLTTSVPPQTNPRPPNPPLRLTNTRTAPLPQAPRPIRQIRPSN